MIRCSRIRHNSDVIMAVRRAVDLLSSADVAAWMGRSAVSRIPAAMSVGIVIVRRVTFRRILMI